MKTFETAAATSTAYIPFKANASGGLAGIDFLQQSIKELVDAICKNTGQVAPIGIPQASILWGCINNGTTISEGYIYYWDGASSFGELFHVPSQAKPAGTYINANISATFSGADPTTLTDNVTTSNVHALRDVVLTGSGTPYAGTLPDFGNWLLTNIPVIGPFQQYDPSTWLNTGYSILNPLLIYGRLQSRILTLQGSFIATAATVSTGVLTLPAVLRPTSTGNLLVGTGIVTDPSGTIAQGTVVIFTIDSTGKMTLNGYSGAITNKFAFSITGALI